MKYTPRQISKFTGLNYRTILSWTYRGLEYTKQKLNECAPKFPTEDLEIEIRAHVVTHRNEFQSKKLDTFQLDQLKPGERYRMYNGTVYYLCELVKYLKDLDAYIFAVPELKYTYKILTRKEAEQFVFRKEVKQ